MAGGTNLSLPRTFGSEKVSEGAYGATATFRPCHLPRVGFTDAREVRRVALAPSNCAGGTVAIRFYFLLTT